MIDMHAHILPGVDHGSQSCKMSLTLLDRAQAVGVDTVVATPHFYLSEGHTVASFLERRQAGFDRLNTAMERSGKYMKIIPAAEVTLCLGLSEIDLTKLCITGTDTLLLEMPSLSRWSDWAYNEISLIQSRFDIKLLIAHIDRYRADEIERLFDLFKLRAQINCSSVCSYFTRKKIRKFIDMGIVHALGSDAHRSPASYDDVAGCAKYLSREILAQIDVRSRALLAKEIFR